MCPPKLFGYQTLYFITSKKYYTDLLPVMARVSESRMSIRCLYSITIWPLAITFFPRRNARDDDNWGRLINSYRNWVDGSAITTYQLHSQTLPLVTLKAKSLRKCRKGIIFFGNFKIFQNTIIASGAEFLELGAYIVFRSNFSSYTWIAWLFFSKLFAVSIYWNFCFLGIQGMGKLFLLCFNQEFPKDSY